MNEIVRIPKQVADIIEILRKSNYSDDDIISLAYGFSHNGYPIMVLKRISLTKLVNAVLKGYEVKVDE